MSIVKCTIIVIIVAAYLTFQCAYAQPPTSENRKKLTLETVDCINAMAALYKISNPYISPSEETNVEYTYKPYLKRDEEHYEGETKLTKLMIAKGALAHLKTPDDLFPIQFRYYFELKQELNPMGIKTPYDFCQENNSLLMRMLSFIPFVQTRCMKELKEYPQFTCQEALNHAYHNVVLSEVADSIYGTAYLKHIIDNVEIIYYSNPSGTLEPENYCKMYTDKTHFE